MTRVDLQELILESAKAVENLKAIDEAHPYIVADNPSCGDRIMLQLHFNGEESLTSLGCQVEGCVLVKALCTLIGHSLLGSTRGELDRLVTILYPPNWPINSNLASADLFAITEQQRELIETVQELIKSVPLRYRCIQLPGQALAKALNVFDLPGKSSQ